MEGGGGAKLFLPDLLLLFLSFSFFLRAEKPHQRVREGGRRGKRRRRREIHKRDRCLCLLPLLVWELCGCLAASFLSRISVASPASPSVAFAGMAWPQPTTNGRTNEPLGVSVITRRHWTPPPSPSPLSAASLPGWRHSHEPRRREENPSYAGGTGLAGTISPIHNININQSTPCNQLLLSCIPGLANPSP